MTTKPDESVLGGSHLRHWGGRPEDSISDTVGSPQEIRRGAQQNRFASSRMAQERQSAVAGSTTVNAGLLNELGTLNSKPGPGESPRRDETRSILANRYSFRQRGPGFRHSHSLLDESGAAIYWRIRRPRPVATSG